jgi:EmrB/QacA subfamily drug resistance transporter
MENLDGTVIATALPSIARSFGTHPVNVSIGMSAYLVTLGVFIPASGWLADRFGSRRVFAGAIALFTLASVLCGLANGIATFVATRILQGLGGAMMVPVGRLIVLRATPKERLITMIAILTWPALVAPILGPPVGGFIVEHASWPWIFYLNLPLGILAFVGVFLLIPRVEGRAGIAFDWLGFVTSGLGIALVVAGLEAIGRTPVAWSVVGALFAGGIVLLAVAIRHFRRASAPLIDLSGMRIPTFAVTIWGGSLFRMAIGAVPFLLPLLFQSAFGYDAFHAGLLMMAVFAGNLAMKPATSPILRRFGFRSVLIVNGVANALTLAAIAFLSPGTPIFVAAALLFVGGMCRSMQFTALNTIAFADIPPEHVGGANTLFSTAAQLSMGLGVAAGALALQCGTVLSGSEIGSFRLAFLLVGLAALVSIVDSVRLASGAGANLSAGAAKGASQAAQP